MLEFFATACSGVFAGAAIYISVVQQPAALEAGGGVAAALFPPMYRRAARMQASLAVVGSLSGLLAWLSGAGLLWLAGAVLLGFVIPFTLLRIKPVNDQLLAPGLDPAAPEVAELVRTWGRLHRIRSASSALAFLVFLLG